MERKCWIVTYQDHVGYRYTWAFFKKENAVKCVEEDYYIKFKSLVEEGYEPKCTHNDTDWKELYVPGTGIYSEWHIELSTIR